MSVCRLIPGQNELQEKAVDGINSAVSNNDSGALTKMLNDVNHSSLTEGSNCRNISKLYDELSPAAKAVTAVKLDENPGRLNYTHTGQIIMTTPFEK